MSLAALLLACSDPAPPCVDLDTLPIEGEHAALVREALLEMQELGEICLSAVELGNESSLSRGVLTLDAERPRAGAMYGACRQLAEELDLPDEPAWRDPAVAPPGHYSQEVLAHEGFARHCERESVFLTASLLDVGTGVEPVGADASLLSVVPRQIFMPDLPTEVRQGVPFEVDGDLLEVAFADTFVLTAVSDDDFQFEVRATDLQTGAVLWSLPDRLDFWPEVATLLDGAALWNRFEGRLWHATRGGFTEIASVPPASIDALASDGEGWWAIQDDIAYAYDPVTGLGEALGPATREPHSTPGEVWMNTGAAMQGLHSGRELPEGPLRYSGVSGGRAYTPPFWGAWLSRDLAPHARWQLEAVGHETRYWPEHGSRVAHRVLRRQTDTGYRFTVRSQVP